MLYYPVFTLAVLLLLSLTSVASVPSITVESFMQEVAERYVAEDGLPANRVVSITVTDTERVYAGTTSGLVMLGNNGWRLVREVPSVTVHALASTGNTVYVAAGLSLYKIEGRQVTEVCALPTASVYAMDATSTDVVLGTAQGLYSLIDYRFQRDDALDGLLGDDETVLSVAVSPSRIIVAGANVGLFTRAWGEDWVQHFPTDGVLSWAPFNVEGVDVTPDGSIWFGSPQGVGMFDGESWDLMTGADGLPYNMITTMDASSEAGVWFGTTMGAMRYTGEWAYRQGMRWVPDDLVHDIAVTESGDAWFATENGVGVIRRVEMTLAEKAEFYEQEIEDYIARTPYGYLSEVHLKSPGDKSEIIYTDSDNDGLWTSMYGAGVAFAYAATGDPTAKRRAKKAFEALRYLSVAPAEGIIEQQPGYVARTVIPTSEPDPNLRSSYTIEGQRERRENRDSLWKVYSPRYVLTEDGKYWYKTDTSSDELDGHFFFYPLYYDFVAETEAEKERVREVVRAIIDHLIRNDFTLVDHDGLPTRWSVYGPDDLNYDPNWYVERGLKSLSILSYLAVAEHVTGDPKYGEISRELREKHAYTANAMVTKIQRGVGSGNQSDDEMAIMCYYNLIRYTKDEEFRDEMIYSFFKYWILEEPEMNPFFNFAYAAHGLGETVTNPWGTHDISPWDGWLEDSLKTLKGFPLDRLNWPHRNSHRLDIQMLERQAAYEPYEGPDGPPRGHRVSGKVIPVENRHFNHWNTNPWNLDYGGNGQTLASGTVYLLPYYMGLYHGFIEE